MYNFNTRWAAARPPVYQFSSRFVSLYTLRVCVCLRVCLCVCVWICVCLSSLEMKVGEKASKQIRVKSSRAQLGSKCRGELIVDAANAICSSRIRQWNEIRPEQLGFAVVIVQRQRFSNFLLSDFANRTTAAHQFRIVVLRVSDFRVLAFALLLL